MFLELTRIYGSLIVINSDKIRCFTRGEHGTSGILEDCTDVYLDDNKHAIQVIEDFDFIMNCLQN